MTSERPSPHLPPRLPLRRLVALARPERARLLVGTLFLLVGGAAALAIPQAMRVVVDAVLEQRRGDVLNKAAVAMVAIAAVQSVAAMLRYYFFTTSGERVVMRLRERLFEALLDQEIAFFDASRTGELASRLQSDTTVLQNAVSVNISQALRQAVMTVGGIGALLWTSPTLTGVILAVVPAVAFGAVIYGRRVRKLSRAVQDALARSGEVAEESLAGVRTVRSFAAEPREVARYRAAVQGSFALARTRAWVAGAFFAAVTFAGLAAAALVFWYGGRLVFRGDMSTGGLISFLVYTMFVGFSLGGLAELWADFMKAAGAGERVFELIDRVPAIPPRGGLTLDRVEGRLAFEGVSFAYPTRADVGVLDGITLDVAPGERVALVGPSGSGKSTIAALVSRLYDPSAGRVRLDGHDVKTLDPAWLRRQVGVVAQEPILFSTTVAENIRYGRPEATDAEVQEAARAAHAHDFVQTFPDGYATQVGERGIQLSGGQKQRVAIARAVLKDPRILVLDEATSALDAESEHLVKEALERLMRGRTTLVIAHRLSTVRDADRVVVVEGGRVVQAGSHAALMGEDGMYRRLVERQFVAA